MFSASLMEGYLPGIHPATQSIDGVWTCPSVDPDELRDADRVLQWTSSGYFNGDYAYYGRSEKWLPGTTNHPELLTENTLRSDRILMTDYIRYYSPPNAWGFNHGARSAFVNLLGAGNAGSFFFAGTNELYGDGHVDWKPRDAFNVPQLINPAGTTPRVYLFDGYYPF